MVFHSLVVGILLLGHQQGAIISQPLDESELANLSYEVKQVVEAMGPNKCRVKPFANAANASGELQTSYVFSGGRVHIDKLTRRWRTIYVDAGAQKPMDAVRTQESAQSDAVAICQRVFGSDLPSIRRIPSENDTMEFSLTYVKDGYPILGDMYGFLTLKNNWQGASFLQRPIRPKHFRNSVVTLTTAQAIEKSRLIAQQFVSSDWQVLGQVKVGWEVPNYKERGVALGLDYRTQSDMEDGESGTARLTYFVCLVRTGEPKGVSLVNVYLDAATGEKLYVVRV